MRANRMKAKRKSKWRIFGYSLLGVVIVLAAVFGIAYYKLQPKNHFKTNSLPVVGTPGETSISQKQNTFNVLLMGSDERKGSKIGHSDSILLVHVNLNTKKFQAVSIPRDTRIHLAGWGHTKLTSVQYVIQATKGQKQGVEAAVQAVSELTGVPINYYVETNYWGLQSMVNAIGGINMNVPFDVKLTHPWYAENKNKVISAGQHFFNGKMVTEVVHERYSLKNGEYGRQQLQKEAMKGIAKEALSTENISKLPALAQSIPDFIIASNMSTSDMLSLGLSVKGFDPDKQLVYHQLHGTGKKIYDDVLKANNDEIIIDPDQIKKLIAKDFQN